MESWKTSGGMRAPDQCRRRCFQGSRLDVWAVACGFALRDREVHGTKENGAVGDAMGSKLEVRGGTRCWFGRWHARVMVVFFKVCVGH